MVANAQDVTARLQSAFQQFENDSQLKAAISSLHVMDTKTGKIIFSRNAKMGLAPASTQKVITSIAAYELLGKDFRYQTNIGYTGKIVNGKLMGDIIIVGSGDPTFGSWRWAQTTEERVVNKIIQAIAQRGITAIGGGIYVDASGWEKSSIPDGWIWQDIGNYYGAGHHALNWRENQFDVYLKSGNGIGDEVQIVGYKPKLYGPRYISELISAAKGSGDNAYIYPFENKIRGTIPVNENKFTISGSFTNPAAQFVNTLYESLQSKGITISKQPTSEPFLKTPAQTFSLLHTETSPPLDSIVYWLNKKSINLYGEALLKTIAMQTAKKGEWSKSIDVVKKFYQENGIEPVEINIVDGSGLSPLNRVTTSAETGALFLAKKNSWFNGFYQSLPEYNGMKIKSGTINGAKAFTGYHTSKKGAEYVFSFIVNNYNGSSSSLVQKMYKVLDELK